jgi:hypothetical protein
MAFVLTLFEPMIILTRPAQCRRLTIPDAIALGLRLALGPGLGLARLSQIDDVRHNCPPFYRCPSWNNIIADIEAFWAAS